MSKREPKRLELNRETVRELTREEMGDAAGGRISLPTQYCTGYYPSINAPCITVRVCV
jgi:hypothetical protein